MKSSIMGGVARTKRTELRLQGEQREQDGNPPITKDEELDDQFAQDEDLFRVLFVGRQAALNPLQQCLRVLQLHEDGVKWSPVWRVMIRVE